jgi:CubicO group peptidase (beta-lactamase class C family)
LSADVERLHSLVSDVVPDVDGPGCAVGLVRAGQPVAVACRGLANLEHGVPITDRTVFHVASVSKQFTAYAVALLAAEGRLRLDDPVVSHLDWFPFPEITVDHLIRHTSGLRDQWELVEAAGRRMEDVITTGDIVGMVAAQRSLNFPPGTRFQYANTGYTLLGLIVEVAGGLPLPAYCARRIFEPVGMTRTRFVDDHHEVVPGRADSYGGHAGHHRRIVLSYSTAGATSLNTTVTDLARWAVHTMTPAMRALREQPPDDGGHDYGLGVLLGTFRGTTAVRHSGADAGYRSHLMVLPECELAAIALANSASIEPESLCDAILGGVLGIEGPQPARVTAPVGPPNPSLPGDPVSPDPYLGLFYSDEIDTHARVLARGGELFLVRPMSREAPLRRLADGSFVADLHDTVECREATIVFSPDGGEFRYSTPTAHGIRFRRVRTESEMECWNSACSR